MIDTVALKNKVLALAFQGKLVEQTNENAHELYLCICNERDLLIKQKAIKKNKTKPILADDITFQIPPNWIWVRLGDVINLQSGQDLTTSDYNDKVMGVPYITGASNFRTDEGLIINRWTEIPKAIALENDILLSVKGTVGKLAFLHEKEVHIARQIMGIRPIGLNRKYVKYFVQEQVEELKAISKGLIPGIERDNVLNMLMPLPPLNEQETIVEKIEEAFTQLDIIETLQQRYLSNLEVLKSKIIDAGIQGKLTEQLPEDGTAEELLEQIAEEKKQLTKEKKIKATKTLPEITEDEIPFEIPNNWEFVRLGDVLNEIIVPQRDKPKVFDGDIPWCRIEDAEGIYLRRSLSNQNVSQATVDEMNLRVCPKGTILSACSGASIGRILITESELCTNQTFNGLVCSSGLYNKYLFYYMNHMIDKLRKMGTGAAMAYISQDKTAKMVIPFPPYNEQVRIVDKIDRIMDLI